MEALTFPGTLDSLELIRKYVKEAAEKAGLQKKSTYRLCLAVDEIAANSVIHGYEEAGLQGALKVHAELDDASLKIILEDEGHAFDPRHAPPPDHKDLPIEERPIGGLGVYLTLKGVDEFQYERKGKWNRHIFNMRRASECSQS
ncbi:putative anti-sigma regulatory factor, serine/threonine protein kinase [Candidatus Vecturithrix granuli]|uniref:Putative anti-sigma regulatory factor, serine/threonine protein kinase n=1 Tax=Vecturithrix granuli TaxID=1499967 RepID=A0A0S6W730_VECG1|nr:putative anti-sigma regulatory factor, serine/threonine protein kinase [Candidatus Vecturithrix granuli]